jgi:hypothetical protein
MARVKRDDQARGEPDLRGKTPLYLWSFFGINLALFIAVVVNHALPQSLDTVEHFWSQVSARNGMIAVFIPIAVIAISGFFSDTTKARLVFWRWHDPLPGTRAFTSLMEKDPRIEAKVLASKYGKFPRKPSAQNALWYRIYREHKFKRMVWTAQQSYLLARDLTALAACFAVLFPAGAASALAAWRTVVVYECVLLAQFLLVATAARNYGVRFVLDVLAEECISCRTTAASRS